MFAAVDLLPFVAADFAVVDADAAVGAAAVVFVEEFAVVFDDCCKSPWWTKMLNSR